MKKLSYIFMVLLAFASFPAKAQNVMFNAYFDSLHIDTKEMHIGEHAKYTLELSVDSGFEVEMPLLEKRLTDGIEILGSKRYKTTGEKGRKMFKDEYTITSFVDTLQTIPAIHAKVNGDTYYTNTATLLVNTVPVDTANLKNIKGLRGVWDVRLTWNELRDAVYLSFLLVVFLALLIWIVVRYIKNKPIIRIVRIKPRKPSHFTALQKIDEIKSDNVLLREESAKDYYTRLTDALREYMYNRYKFNATDMTTGEIIENLLKFNDKEAIKELQEVLEVADLVKFAKFMPSQNENNRNMLSSIDFINATKDVEEEKLKPVEKRVVNERSMNQKRWLIAAIVAVLGVLVAVVALLITDLGNMLG